jgi:hypothetical protein
MAGCLALPTEREKSFQSAAVRKQARPVDLGAPLEALALTLRLPK